MKNLWRSIRILIEIAIACLIFFFIATKTPLFDRAITNPSQTRTGSDISSWALTPATSGWIITSWTQYPILETPPISYTPIIKEIPIQGEHKECTSPRWTTIPHGTSIKAYKHKIATMHGNICQSQIRTCNNGHLEGSYRHEECFYAINGLVRTADNIIEQHKGANNEEQSLINLSEYIKKKHTTPREFTQPSITPNTTAPTLAEVKPHLMTNGKKPSSRLKKDTLEQEKLKDNPNNRPYRSCRTPRGTRVEHGDFVYAYNSNKSSPHQQCISQVRSCINGELNGTFLYPSCEITSGWIGTVTNYQGEIVQRDINEQHYPPSHNHQHTFITNNDSNWNCTTPRGTTIAHSSTIIAYRLPTSTDNSLCDQEIRTCKYGVLHGSFEYETCSEQKKNPPKPKRRQWWK